MTHIPMSSPDLTDAEREAVLDVLHGTVLSLGTRTTELERRLADYVGVRHAVAVSSGTAALHLSMIANGIGDGDLVITSPFSFIASANCILYERGIPIFVDVDAATGNLDPTAVAAAVEDLASGRDDARRWLPPHLRDADRLDPGALKAILPVHAFGQPADMQPIVDTARRFGLRIVEDACEALGAEYRGGRTGTFGDTACFAFYPNKQMTTGEGGVLVTNDDRIASLCASLRNQGRDVFDAWLRHTRLGYNYRLDELSAALGVVQLSRLDDMLARRARVAAWYDERLRDLDGLDTPHVAETTTRMSWFVYVVRFDSAKRRTAAMHALAEREIPARPYFTPIHLQPFYVDRFGFRRGDFPVTERLGETSLALPFSSVMTEDQVDQVCCQLASVVREHVVR
ncbi:MAG TPA: DegT/DnrJ/EryC1/StrS family aminotransferase [Vicinamibacterales bacterium]|nr:DegT/DnrJ/EryC1/StrS family aminotransferase [Vicinamibacterales bacterium]